ncbi:MAG TPA: hypothetical protein VGE30_01490 [Candidatus Saccharimonadales bacterium]
MNKRHLHHYWRAFRTVKPVYFLLLALIFGAMSVVALRDNNQRMAELRDAVYAADKDNGDVQTALNNLQAHVTAHMNTSLTTGSTAVYPPIQLQHTYQRLVQEKSAAQNSANQDLYTRAQAYCQSQNSSDFSGRNRVPCIEKYVQDNGVKPGSVNISPSLYQYDFVAPRWSPDLAGWSLVLAFLFGFLAVAKFIVDRFLASYLR